MAAAGVPLLLMVGAEGLLRFAGYGYLPDFFLNRRVAGRDTLTDNPDFGRRFFPRGLQRAAQPFRLPDSKSAGTLRIFVMGESAAMGDPDLKFGLPRMLTALLRARYPDKQIEVVNTAIVAIDSHVILPIARECAGREGDLWVIYMGNNEIIGPFGSASVFGTRAPPLSVVRAGLWLRTTRVGQLLDACLRVAERKAQGLPEWTGMEMMAGQKVRYDSPATKRVQGHFERNLDDLLRTGVKAGVPIVLCTVASNLKDCAPFASLHRAELGDAQLREWEAEYKSGIACDDGGELTKALSHYAKAAQMDADFADLGFRRGRCSERLGLAAEALGFFREARDKDALQFRADDEINGRIRAAALKFASRRVNLVDAEALLATNSPQGLPGANFFYEHVHLTPEGNYLVARAIAEQASRALSLPSGREWISQSECFRLLGLTEWNRYDALNTILDRIQGAPFTRQLDHTNQLQTINEQIARYKPATKPAQVRKQATQVAALVSHDPEDASLRWNLAGLLQSAGDYSGAEEQWRKLMELQPQSALPPYNLAKLLEGMGRQTEALPLYNGCVRLDPDNYGARLGSGLLYLQMGKPHEAIGQLRMALRLKPGSEEVRLALERAEQKTADPK